MIRAIIVFVLVCLMGLFCFWIGDGRPFTEGAGVAAFFTFLFASFAALMTTVMPRNL